MRREGGPGIEWFKEKAIQSKCSCVSGAHQDPGKGANISSNAPQVNLSFSAEVQTEVPMSSWLHSPLISAHPSRAASGHLDSAPTSGESDPGRMLLAKHWPSGCTGSPFAGQGPDRWSNTAKDPAKQHCGDSKAGFLFYLSLSLVTQHSVLPSSTESWKKSAICHFVCLQYSQPIPYCIIMLDSRPCGEMSGLRKLDKGK